MAVKVVLSEFVNRNREAKFRISVEQVAIFSGPGVYVFYDFENNPLYIGSSKCVMGRCMGIHHRAEVRKMANHIEIHPCNSHEHALRLEKRLIKELSPKFNGQRRTRNAVDILTNCKTREEMVREVWR